MKTFILTFCLILAACVANYDATEYSKTVDAIVSISDPTTFCDKTTLVGNVQKLQKDIRWIIVYDEGQANNKDTVKMMAGVEDEVNRFSGLANVVTMTPTYCKLKLKSISDTLQTVLKAEGSKSK